MAPNSSCSYKLFFYKTKYIFKIRKKYYKRLGLKIKYAAGRFWIAYSIYAIYNRNNK